MLLKQCTVTQYCLRLLDLWHDFPSKAFVLYLEKKTTEIRKSEKFFQVLLKDYDCLYLICIDIIPKIA